MSLFRIALVQHAPRISDVARNLSTVLERLREAADAGAQLALFPECALSGYVFESLEDARPAAESVPGPTTEAITAGCRESGIYAVVGMLEADGDAIYNSAVVIGPDGIVACYRKTHLPVLGIDRFATKGSMLPIIELPFARVGILICYDVRFPEAARSLALRGADLLLVPTNWPEGAESAPEYLTRARAWENRVYIAACNRVGIERGVRFIGRSQVINPAGVIIEQADGESDTIVLVEIDPERARQKKLIIQPGVFELDPVGGRRPDLYGDLVPLPVSTAKG